MQLENIEEKFESFHRLITNFRKFIEVIKSLENQLHVIETNLHFAKQAHAQNDYSELHKRTELLIEQSKQLKLAFDAIRKNA